MTQVWVVLVDGSGTLHSSVDAVRVFESKAAVDAESARTDGGFGGYARTGRIFGPIDVETVPRLTCPHLNVRAYAGLLPEGGTKEGEACMDCGETLS